MAAALRSLRLVYQVTCCRFHSTKISYNQLKKRISYNISERPNITSEISAANANQPNFTVSYLINSCGLSPKDAVSASTKVKLQNPTRADSVLALLSNYGLSETQISKIVRSYTRVLAADPEKTIAPKIEFYINIGLSREDLAKILTYNPTLLTSSLEKQIVPAYNFLRKLISQEQVAAVLKNTWILKVNFSKKINPNIEHLRELGVPEKRISHLVAHTHVLLQNHEDLAEAANEVKEMGFDVKKTTFVEALKALCGESSRSIYNRNREIFKSSWGWSEDDVVSAFRRRPLIMTLSEKKIMRTMDFVVNNMELSATKVLSNPLILCLSLENRIIPRGCVVKVLMSKKLVDENLCLATVMKHADKVFLEKFVTRYLDQVPELLSVYEGKLDFQAI